MSGAAGIVCRLARELLDPEAPGPTGLLGRRHLRACAACQAERARGEAVVERLRAGLGRPRLPPGLQVRTERAVEAALLTPAGPGRPRTLTRLAWATGAAAGLTLALTLLWSRRDAFLPAPPVVRVSLPEGTVLDHPPVLTIRRVTGEEERP